MNLKTFLSICWLLNFTGLKAQNAIRDSILRSKAESLAYTLNNTSLKTNSFNLKLDSINVYVKYNPRKITTTNFFQKSNLAIEISYYFKNGELKYIEGIQRGVLFPNQIGMYQYYIKNSKIIKEESGSVKGISFCVSYTWDDIDKMARDTHRLDAIFLRSYVINLLDEIKLKANKVRILRSK